MSLRTQRQLRRAARLRLERKRDGGLALGAVLFHALLILLLPAVATPSLADTPLQLILHPVVAPVVPSEQKPATPAPKTQPFDGDSAKATAPTIDKQIRPDTPPGPLPPRTKHSGKDSSERKPAATSPKPSNKPSSKPVVKPSPGKPQSSPSESSPAKDSSDATDVVVREPIAAPVKDKPTENKQPAKKGDSAKPNPGDKGVKPNPGKGDGGGGKDKKDAGDNPQNPGNARAGDPKPAAPKDGDDKGKGDGAGAPSGGGPATAPEAGPPALPAGPTAAELDLLGDYGEKCKKKIRQLARNPELAREKHHEGPVKFSFTVSRRGKLLDVSVLSSAGYGELDEEAREATRVASSSFGPFPKTVLSVEQWTFTMTLKFPLY